MSLIAHHRLLSGGLLTPALRIVSLDGAIATGSTYTIIPANVPLVGSLLVITAGGSQNRTVVTPPVGFTQLASIGTGIPTNVMFYRVCTGSEPGSWTIVWSGNLNGGWDFQEFLNVDTASPFGFHYGNQGVGITTLAPAASGYSVTAPGVAFTYISKTLTTAWTPNSGYTDYGGPGEHKRALKYFSVPTTETVNWSGASQNVTGEIVLIKGKLV